MARIVVALPARDDLDGLIRSRGLPASTRDRVKWAVAHLAEHPLVGPALGGRWDGFRFLLGPWPWMLIVYAYDEAADLVIIVSFEDAREAGAPRS